MSEFLRSTAPYSQYPVFAEMATFEWAKSDAFDAADSAVADISDMAAIPPTPGQASGSCRTPRCGASICAWNVPTVWKEIDAGREPPEIVESEYRLLGCSGARTCSLFPFPERR